MSTVVLDMLDTDIDCCWESCPARNSDRRCFAHVVGEYDIATIGYSHGSLGYDRLLRLSQLDILLLLK